MKKKSFSLLVALIAAVSTISSAFSISLMPTTPAEVNLSPDFLTQATIAVQNDTTIILTKTNNILAPSPANGMAAYCQERVGCAATESVVLLTQSSNETNRIYNELLLAKAGSGGHNYKIESDTIVGISIHCTVYYTVQTVDGYDWYRITRVTGGNNKSGSSAVIGSGYVIKNQAVNYGIWGNNLEGYSPVLNIWSSYNSLNNSSNSFDFDVATLYPNWPTVLETNSILGTCYTMTVHNARDDSTREIEVLNNILSDPATPTPWN